MVNLKVYQIDVENGLEAYFEDEARKKILRGQIGFLLGSRELPPDMSQERRELYEKASKRLEVGLGIMPRVFKSKTQIEQKLTELIVSKYDGFIGDYLRLSTTLSIEYKGLPDDFETRMREALEVGKPPKIELLLGLIEKYTTHTYMQHLKEEEGSPDAQSQPSKQAL